MKAYGRRPPGAHMFKSKFCVSTLIVLLSCSASLVLAGAKDDPLLTRVLIDQLELRGADDGEPWILDGQAWIGKDLQKLRLKAEVERNDGETEEAELQALYSQAVAPYWDLQLGFRQDLEPARHRNWAVIGVQGLAPYFFEIDTALYIGESGRTAFRLEAEYELLLTQRLILTPEIEVNLYGQDDRESGTGSGLSDVEAGLRLRYEIWRELAPYIGVTWSKRFGRSADFTHAEGGRSGDYQWLIGVRAWF